MVSAAFYSVGTIYVLAYGFPLILWSFLGVITAGASWRAAFGVENLTKTGLKNRFCYVLLPPYVRPYIF